MYGFAGSGNWKTLLKEYRLDGEGIAESILHAAELNGKEE
jgi:hypothetical protein